MIKSAILFFFFRQPYEQVFECVMLLLVQMPAKVQFKLRELVWLSFDNNVGDYDVGTENAEVLKVEKLVLRLNVDLDRAVIEADEKVPVARGHRCYIRFFLAPFKLVGFMEVQLAIHVDFQFYNVVFSCSDVDLVLVLPLSYSCDLLV